MIFKWLEKKPDYVELCRKVAHRDERVRLFASICSEYKLDSLSVDGITITRKDQFSFTEDSKNEVPQPLSKTAKEEHEELTYWSAIEQ